MGFPPQRPNHRGLRIARNIETSLIGISGSLELPPFLIRREGIPDVLRQTQFLECGGLMKATISAAVTSHWLLACGGEYVVVLHHENSSALTFIHFGNPLGLKR